MYSYRSHDRQSWTMVSLKQKTVWKPQEGDQYGAFVCRYEASHVVIILSPHQPHYHVFTSP